MRDTQPPLDFFVTSSATGLQSYELSRMNLAANLRKELRQIMEQWVQAEANAQFARLVMESRTVPSPEWGSTLPSSASAAAAPSRSFEQLAISFLPAHDPDTHGATEEVPLVDRRILEPSAAGSAPTATVAPAGEIAGSVEQVAAALSALPMAVAPLSARGPCSTGLASRTNERIAAPARDPKVELAAQCIIQSSSALDRCAERGDAVLDSLKRSTPESRHSPTSGKGRPRPTCARLIWPKSVSFAQVGEAGECARAVA